MNRCDDTNMTTIINSLRQNNYDYFDEFYDLTKRQVFYAIFDIVKSRQDTEDVMQETYIKFLDNIKKYKENTNVIAFIVTIARNLAINLYNKKKKRVVYDFDDYESIFIDPNGKDTDNSLIDLVYKTLKGDELEVFVLHVIDDLKHKEIAKIMGKPLGTVTWLFNKAVKKMKERIGDDDEVQ